jgi:transposase
MQKVTEETKKKVVKLHIQDGRTISSLSAEYGVCHATISNWIRAYREECQTNDASKSEYELMQEVHKLRQELAEAKKENDFLKKAAAFFAKEID